MSDVHETVAMHRDGEHAVKKTVNLRYVLFLAITAALGGLLFGFDIAICTEIGRAHV